MSNKFLILRLKGPMQSWGLRAKFDYRYTETMPTKSGIIGLLGAALGLDRSDTSGLKALSELKLMTVCTREGVVITDFHTVGSGYDKHDHPEKFLTTAFDLRDPTKKLPTKNAVTRRQYLCDYEFLAVLQGESDLINRCASKVRDPVYQLFLGRKCCMPSLPVLVGTCSDRQKLKKCLRDNGWRDNQRISCEVNRGGQLEQDVPVNFKTRKFSSRRISGDATDWLG